MMKSRVDKQNWIRCGKCGHKLARVVGAGYCDPSPIIEIKCHSCKELNIWAYDLYRTDKDDDIHP